MFAKSPTGYSLEVQELEDQISQLKKALALAIRQNENDMIMTGEELRFCEKIQMEV